MEFRDGKFFFFLVTLSLKHTHACTHTPMSVHAVNAAQVHCSRVPGGGGGGGGGTGGCWGAEEEQ